jgi:uncharacterized NAD(P)/FAD-binding protein YdhS
MVELTFAIIGCGLTGTATFCRLTRILQEKAARPDFSFPRIRIAVVEKKGIFGPGFPYSEAFVMPCHMTNTCSEEMGIPIDDPRDFKEWAEAEYDRLARQCAAFPKADELKAGPCTYYPRAVMGEYLRARFKEAVNAAQELGCDVLLHSRCEALDASEKGGKVRLLLRKLESEKTFYLEADRLLLATGHWFPEGEDTRFFPSPWPSRELLDRVPRGAKVAVLGSSLSAIDAVMTLTSEGVFYLDPSGELQYGGIYPMRQIALCSRSGILPKVRGKMGEYRNRFLTQMNLRALFEDRSEKPVLEELFRLLSLDLEAAYGHAVPWAEAIKPSLPALNILEQDLKTARHGDGPYGELLWQTVFHQSFSTAREVYLHLSDEEKMRFEKHYSTLFFAYAAPMPPLIAEKLLALMKSGIAQVIKLGEDYRILNSDAGKGYEIIYQGPHGERERGCYDYLVDGRGQSRSFTTNPSELARNLLRSGTVQVERLKTRPPCVPSETGETPREVNLSDSGGLWIDPETHQALRTKADGSTEKSQCIYAAGIMTRGQILDASTARGCILSAARVVGQWTEFL